MTTILQNLVQEEINNALVGAVHEHITQVLQESRPGHCLRVSALPKAVMETLCVDFNANGTQADVVLLLGPRQQPNSEWQVTATRLIELRNEEKRPLLAFVPPGLKAAAEDSFDVSTFVEIDLGDVPHKLRKQLQYKLSEELQNLTDRVIHYMEKTERLINDDDIVRYYLTILQNGNTHESAGGAIYQLHLVPDFALFDITDRIEQRLDRNVTAVRILTESNKPLLGRIHNLKLKPNTIQSDLYRFLRARILKGVPKWSSIIATDDAYRHLSFDQWQFEGEVMDRERILLFVDELKLPAKERDQPIGPDNPLYIDLRRAGSVRIKWETNPKPATLNKLTHFRIEIISADGAPVWESKNIRKTSSSRAFRSKTLKVKEFRDQVEDGLYFFRVRAYSKSGEIINEENPEKDLKVLRDPQNPEGKRINESEDVWFWEEENDEPPPADPQRNVTVNSFLDAQLRAQFAAIDRSQDPFSNTLQPQPDKTSWAVAKTKKRAEAIYNIVYDAQARYTLPINNLLRRIESDTLAQPDNLGRWRLNFTNQQTTHYSVEHTPRQFRHHEQIPQTFLEARAALFTAIKGEQRKDDLLTATVDLMPYQNFIFSYTRAYGDWLSQVQSDFETLAIRKENGRRHTEPIFLDLDTVEVILSGGDRVYLLGPTHPLRLLWHLQRSRMAHSWLKTAVESGEAQQRVTQSVRSYMRQGLVPVNLPPVIRIAHEKPPEGVSRFYVEQGPLTYFWSLYVPEDVRDKQTLRARVQRALGMRYESAHVSAVGGINKELLTQKLQRYLVQHPYVHAFKINVFNPGDAALIVEAILCVEKERHKSESRSLRYELRLFTQKNTRLDDVGEAVDDLLNPERQVSAEADAFTVPSKNHLFPKLRFSRNRLSDFLEKPEQYEAHIAILYDLFPVKVEIQKAGAGRSSFAYGLIQEQVNRFTGHKTNYAWQRQLVPSPCQELPQDDTALSAHLAQLLKLIGELQASVAAGHQVNDCVPTLGLRLNIEDKNLLYQVHAVSDWVFIIDRYLGVEYFDSNTPDNRPAYLLDFTPEFGDTDTERLLLTTRAVEEVSRLIRPALDKYDLLADEGVEVYFLQLLRSLSGRLALKLLSSPNHVKEALGLAMARLFLEQYGLLIDRIVLPLDAHTHLFANQTEILRERVSLQRGDLLLVSCNPQLRTIHFHIIEVKWRTNLSDFNAYMNLRHEIEEQLTSSQEALQQHFDPQFRSIDRIDRQVKTKEFISLLNFYLERSRRYGLIRDEALTILRPFIESLDEGYRLTCAGVGLIFDFSYERISTEEEHSGLSYHRVGRDYSRRLLNNGLRRRALLQQQAQKTPATIEEFEKQQQERERIIENTTMRRDASFHDVRTGFPTPLIQQPEPISIPEPLKESPEADVAHESVLITEPVLAGEPKPEVVVEREAKPHPVHEQSPALEPLPVQVTSVEQALIAVESVAGEVKELHPTIATQMPDDKAEDAKAIGAADEAAPPTCDVLLGMDKAKDLHQYGILGQAGGKFVGLDLNGTNTISLFGVQGAGKSYTIGSIVEMATQPFANINLLPSPLATVIFHYHESQDYAPEFVSMVAPNSKEAEIRALTQEYGAEPGSLKDVLILTSADKIAERRAEFPSVRIEPIHFSSSELSFTDWRFLMGAFGNQMYMKQINLIMRQLRGGLTLHTLQEEIEKSALSEIQKNIARIRLTFAAQFVNDTYRLAEMLHPGRLIIVDLRDEFIDKDEALGLFVVMLNIFANAGRDEGFNKLIVFDEAHKYMDDKELTGHIVNVIRQMRHQGVSLLIASQDPPSLPNAIIELSSLIILHRFNSPQWIKHVQRSVTALSNLSPAQMATLRPGDAYVWSTKATERVFTQKAVKMRLRPRVTQHGGGTKTAI